MSEYVFAETQAQHMLRALELPVDSKPDAVVDAVNTAVGELATLRSAADAETQEKIFSEQYPAFYAEHNRLMERDRENTARNFSESVKTVRRSAGKGLIDTKQGLSAVAQTKVVEMHKKFSEGTATIEDFEECIKAITNGGIVTFGELASGKNPDEPPQIDTSNPTGVAQARKVFAELITNEQKLAKEAGNEISYEQAMAKAAEKHPDIAASYSVALPA